MYDPEYTSTFYDAYGDLEWARLESKPYGRLQAIIHNDFIQRHVQPNDKVLDAGSGPGRFSISLINIGAKVTLLDISKNQLNLARSKLSEAGLIGKVESFVEGDIVNLGTFPDASFDKVICFGGALSYVCERRYDAASELIRVTPRGGLILVSVMSLLGAAVSVITMPSIEMLEHPNKVFSDIPPLFPILETGDLPEFPSTSGMKHAPMHLYTSYELQQLFEQCTVVETAGSNVTMNEYERNAELISNSPVAWDTLIEFEKRINHDPGLLNSGSHIIMVVRK